ncbi:MAG: TetR/AcrR family transcriptional regulator [Vampirovibrio sp.]|nr:TetR/AcrR family transcriptional regulator [Vampirovibrio sp.]
MTPPAHTLKPATPAAEKCCGSREKLIQTTIELMSSKGFGGMGITELLNCAGVTRSNFYYHFDSKEQLCLQALDELAMRYKTQFLEPTLFNMEWTPAQRLESLVNAMIERLDSEECCVGCPFINLAAETSDFHPAFREKLVFYTSQKRQSLEDCYRQGVAAGEFRADLDPATVAQAIQCLFNGTILMAKLTKSVDVARSNRDMLFQWIKA